jgi:hypothetical protein
MKHTILQEISSLKYDWRELHQSKVYNNGNFDYRLFYEIVNYKPACGENGFSAAVYAVKTPKYLPKEKIKSVKQTMCVDKVTCEEIFEYGIYARLEDTPAKTIKDAREKLNELMGKEDQYNTLFGFYMDKQQNQIGNTGWDFIAGNIG